MWGGIHMDSALLAKEFVKRETSLEEMKDEKLFTKISKKQYIEMNQLKRLISKTEDGKTITVKQVADRLHKSITDVSKIFYGMEEKGLIIWNMRYEEGKRRHTYVEISKHGEELLKEQDEILEEFYSNVLKHFSEDQVFKLIGEFSMFDRIIEEELYNL